jgi:hypothetical protein
MFTKYEHILGCKCLKHEWSQTLDKALKLAAVTGARFEGDKLLLSWIDGKDWLVERDFVYVAGNGDRYLIPKGFITDFASIPRIFWSILPPTGDYGPAAVLHDFLYRTGVVSRARADDLFFEAMGVLGVASWKRYTIWYGVHVLGAPFYKGSK